MTRHLPTEQHVRQVMDEELRHSRQTGRRPTITAVERKLDIPHATFYRHYADLVANYFQPRVGTRGHEATSQPPNVDAALCDTETLARLRRENTDLRKLVSMYEEAIRQLTLDNHDIHSRLLDHTAIVPISRRTRR